jgi:alpha-L-fucosidase
MKKSIVSFYLILSLLFNGNTLVAQENSNNKMDWFSDAKLGIFIHWGIYSVDGVDESWAFYNKKMTHEAYMKQLKGFTAKNYQPEEWANLIKESGARYAVITTKHHDGVALYNSAVGPLNIVKQTPAKRDVLKPFYDELRKRNIKTGAYFSLIDWSHPNYPAITRDSSRYKVADQPVRWNQFQNFFQSQIEEISKLYNPDLFWFDGDWEHSSEEWEAKKVREKILAHNPNAIINGRLQGFGDYETPEQNFPVSKLVSPYWELCMTTNNNWGYQPNDTNWKTPYEIITIFADVVSYGGNLLLDIGPKEDGTIPAEQIHILKELGKWNVKHSEAIFGTTSGLPNGHFYGPSTLSKDKKTLYLFIAGNTQGPIMIKGLKNKITEIKVVGTKANLPHKVVGKISWSPVPGLVYIDIPSTVQDEYMTVLELKLDVPLDLYQGKGGLQ